jgi:hypothetical protein
MFSRGRMRFAQYYLDCLSQALAVANDFHSPTA